MVTKWIFRRFMGLQIYVYRRSGGKRMSQLRGMPILLLTTIGRKSGKKHATPVMYIRDGDNYVVTASNNGAEENPAWFLNLRVNPMVTVEVGGETKAMVARRASREEKLRLWPQLVEKAPFFEGYKKKTDRDIPMIILEASDVSTHATLRVSAGRASQSTAHTRLTGEGSALSPE